ncbi:Squamous cell carcinoma antigen recognized by T-cells 3 [Phlyctochytrium bullatum]|nr:Squamous cell carcinoma antigen recognized by T-cells 3 [Phlyctochytrium bullatum]
MEALAESPLSYDLHLKLVTQTRDAGLAEELRLARESMHGVFPLSEELWVQWIEDEESRESSEAQRQYILDLYKKATEDYLYSDEDDMDTDKKTEGWLAVVDARAICSDAIRSTQLHLTKGHEVWNAVKDFELRALERDNNPERLEKVRQMFIERLKTPHMSTLIGYDPQGYEVRMQAASAMKSKAEQEYFLRDKWEMKLLSESATSSDFIEYIAEEKSRGKSATNKKLIRTLFERAIAIYCLDVTVWDAYLAFLVSGFRVKAIVLSVSDRAIRNCSWAAGVTEEVKELIRLYFREAMELLSEKFGKDPYLRLERLLLNYETQVFRDERSARELYHEVLKKEGSSATLWIEAAQFERDYGNIHEARTLYKQAVARKVDSPEAIFSDYLSFEELFGTMDQYYEALGKIKNREGILAKLQPQIAVPQVVAVDVGYTNESTWTSTTNDNMEVLMGTASTGNSEKRGREEAEAGEPSAKKAKTVEPTVLEEDLVIEEPDAGEKQEKRSRPKDYYVLDNSAAGCMVVVKNLPAQFDAKKLKRKRIVDYYIEPDLKTGEPQGFLEFNNAEDAAAMALKDGLKVSGVELKIQRCIPAKVEWGNLDRQPGEQKNKIYVSNLDVNVDKPLIRDVFGQFGKIKEVRMVYRPTIAFAYVEFEVDASADRACSLDNTTLEQFPKRRVSVKISNPELKKPAIVDKRELFVSNFALATKAEELVTLFSQHGTVKDVRLLHTKDGLPRGAGFVEFESEENAKAALALNGTNFGGRILAVTPSDPNVRSKSLVPRAAAKGNQRKPEREGAADKDSKSSAAVDDAKLMPPPPPPQPVASSSSTTEPMKTDELPKKTGKSQDDFRKMMGIA